MITTEFALFDLDRNSKITERTLLEDVGLNNNNIPAKYCRTTTIIDFIPINTGILTDI
jgi:hypothetical protein